MVLHPENPASKRRSPKHKLFRYARIIISTASAITCVLLAMLWVRSYWWIDRVDWPIGRSHPGWTATTVSVHGLLLIGVQPEQYNAYANQLAKLRVISGRTENVAIDHLSRRHFGF